MDVPSHYINKII